MSDIQFFKIEEDEGYLMTVNEFTGSVRRGFFTDYDGFGKWATTEQKSNVYVSPSQLRIKKSNGEAFFPEQPHWATHVLWYNK